MLLADDIKDDVIRGFHVTASLSWTARGASRVHFDVFSGVEAKLGIAAGLYFRLQAVLRARYPEHYERVGHAGV